MTDSLALPTHAGKAIHWYNTPGAAQALAIAHAVKTHTAPIVVITSDSYQANQLRLACKFFFEEDYPITVLPDWEILPYDHFSPHQDILSERLQALSACQRLSRGLILLPISTALQRLAPQSHVNQSFVLAKGLQLSVDEFRQQLTAAGYYAVSTVMTHGEFAVRGALIDLFPMGSAHPIRIDLFDEEIDSLRLFDPDDQRTIEQIDRFELLPAFEYPLTETAITRFREQWRATFSGDPMNSPIYQQISDGRTIGGIEYYLPLFFEQMATIFDYVANDCCFVLTDGVREQVAPFLAEVEQRYQQRSGDITRPLLKPEQLYLAEQDFLSHLKQRLQIQLHHSHSSQKPADDFHCQSLPDLSVDSHGLDDRFTKLKLFLQTNTRPCLICAETAGREDQLRLMLSREQIQCQLVADWQTFKAQSPALAITTGKLHQGFIQTDNTIVISENDLFGEPVYQTRKRSQKAVDPEMIFKNLAELSIDNPVVHQNHGVGLYKGLVTLEVNDIPQEFVLIEYAQNDKLYVPVSDLDCISRYSGVDTDRAPIHRLGGPEWEKIKKKAAKKAHDVAAELLQLYALRASRKGYRFEIDQAQFNAFSAEFPFTETPDQSRAIDNIIDDMLNEQPMDRLICGDVGFGKTEVAMRAAFIAAMNGKQTAVLVPTTLLAQQHYQTFTDRFANWPVKVAVLSRLSTGKEQKRILEQIQSGQIDIVIGTHKLLQSDIQFKQLQLVILDEEHRFGVRQKERLKSLRAEVDILSMTATPIPRTLNMAMAGIRDLSIISTAPAKRLAIRTFVHEYDSNMIKEAIQREMMRGGQVFYLHNNVDTIEATAERLQELLPKAKIAHAHGQMRERELESVMTAFYHHHYNILVCTTIIETGIDIPTANTIIIERADKFGLAQLHQLRGRVGRSHHQAYAYLITPPEAALTRDAEQRLAAIAQFDDLNVGFSLATLDLEIRGAGDLLGEGQSGHIEEIGFSMYQDMLDRAIKGLKAGELPEHLQNKSHIELNFPVATLLPEDFIPDVHTRLVLYKRLADIINQDQLIDFRIELIDRFGKLPQATEDLIRLTELKLQCQHLGVKKVDVGHQYGRIEFIDQPKVEPQQIIKLIQTQPKAYQLSGQNSLRFRLQVQQSQSSFEQFQQVLTELTTVEY